MGEEESEGRAPRCTVVSTRCCYGFSRSAWQDSDRSTFRQHSCLFSKFIWKTNTYVRCVIPNVILCGCAHAIRERSEMVIENNAIPPYPSELALLTAVYAVVTCRPTEGSYLQGPAMYRQGYASLLASAGERTGLCFEGISTLLGRSYRWLRVSSAARGRCAALGRGCRGTAFAAAFSFSQAGHTLRPFGLEPS